MNSVRQILEIDRILDQVKRYIKTPRGLIILSNLDVFDEKNDCKEELARLSEMLSLIEKYNDLPINSHIDIFDEIQKAKKGSVINEKSFNDIKEVLSSCREIIKFYNKIIEKPTLLSAYFTKIVFDEKLYNKINQVITVDNTVADNASPKLNQIRHSLEKSEKEIHTTISKLMITYKDQLSGDNYVLRDGVYVLPINSSYKASVDGLVHDISDSGMTTFIEPLEIVNLENNKHVLEIQEKEEVTRILKELTQNVIQDEGILTTNDQIIGYFDFLQSKSHYCVEIDGVVPKLLDNQVIKLYLARHPLLDKNTVVPNDFNLGNDKTLMLISGPNAGGKTIALKTVATLCYMTKMGLPIPAGSGSELGFFRKIYVDIGDNQSIENNLSTFSAHISVLSVLLKYISSKDLVVIDELGNGTDPKEGEALSMAVVEYLLDRKCLTLITSHFALLKQFGLGNKSVLSASFIFDDKKIEPTFRIIYDVSGKSYGFAIAKKYGLNDAIVERARKIYEQNYIDNSDRKLEILEDKERSIHEKNEELNAKRKELDSLNSELKKKQDIIEEKEKNLKEKKIASFDEYLDSKIDEIDDIVDEFKASNKKNEKEYIERLNKISVSKKEKEKIEIGDFVEIKGLNVSGKVVRIVGKKVNIVTRDGFSLNASYDQCEKTDGPAAVRPSQTNIDKAILNQKVLSASLNLVGFHIDEGLNTLDKYLSDCYSRGLHVVKVIHGYGSGQLRNAIHAHLKTLSFVESFRLGTDVDGGTGATIVTLK
jgi:DNA mismatch repair protein MutS2